MFRSCDLGGIGRRRRLKISWLGAVPVRVRQVAKCGRGKDPAPYWTHGRGWHRTRRNGLEPTNRSRPGGWGKARSGIVVCRGGPWAAVVMPDIQQFGMAASQYSAVGFVVAVNGWKVWLLVSGNCPRVATCKTKPGDVRAWRNW